MKLQYETVNALLQALEYFMSEKREYMRLNHLGDPEQTSAILLATDALLQLKRDLQS